MKKSERLYRLGYEVIELDLGDSYKQIKTEEQLQHFLRGVRDALRDLVEIGETE
jgi:hypothetical protein